MSICSIIIKLGIDLSNKSCIIEWKGAQKNEEKRKEKRAVKKNSGTNSKTKRSVGGFSSEKLTKNQELFSVFRVVEVVESYQLWQNGDV